MDRLLKMPKKTKKPTIIIKYLKFKTIVYFQVQGYNSIILKCMSVSNKLQYSLT